MTRSRHAHEAELPELVHETATRFVALAAAHLRVVQLELVAGVKTAANQLTLALSIAVMALVGYVLLLAGAALAMAPFMGAPRAFVLLGAVHVLAAAAAAGLAARRQRLAAAGVSQVIEDVSLSVRSLAGAAVPPARADGSPRVDP